MSETNSADAIRQLAEYGARMGRAMVPVDSAGTGLIPYAIVPKDCDLKPLTDLIFNTHTERPERQKGTCKVLDAASLRIGFTSAEDFYRTLFRLANALRGQEFDAFSELLEGGSSRQTA